MRCQACNNVFTETMTAQEYMDLSLCCLDRLAEEPNRAKYNDPYSRGKAARESGELIDEARDAAW